ncbi:MAG: hypothetical protein ACKV19_21880 [Verrucomicrobiales bacterium]
MVPGPPAASRWRSSALAGRWRSACHIWIRRIVEMDAAFDRSWPCDVAYAIRNTHPVWQAKNA